MKGFVLVVCTIVVPCNKVSYTIVCGEKVRSSFCMPWHCHGTTHGISWHPHGIPWRGIGFHGTPWGVPWHVFFSSSDGLVKITTLPRSKFVSCVNLTHSSRCNIRTSCCYPWRWGTLTMSGSMANPAATVTALHGNPTARHPNPHGTPIFTAPRVRVRVKTPWYAVGFRRRLRFPWYAVESFAAGGATAMPRHVAKKDHNVHPTFWT